MNHLAHSEASKTAKTTEANLKNKIEDLENNNAKMEAESRRCVDKFFLLIYCAREKTDSTVLIFLDSLDK